MPWGMALPTISSTVMDKVLAGIITGNLKVKMVLLEWEEYSEIGIYGILAKAHLSGSPVCSWAYLAVIYSLTNCTT